MNYKLLLQLLPILLLTACSGNTAKQNIKNKTNNVTDSETIAQPGKLYMHTGFYYLAEGQQNGVSMQARGSNDTYNLTPKPFASVSNIIEDSLVTEGPYTSLCMKFDAKGTTDLQEGTGNALHPKLAVVIANQLMYVVDNTTKIKTGVMYIILEGYTQQQMQDIKVEVSEKK